MIASLKENDQLVQHVCQSLALSENFTRPQLEMLCEVVSITLMKESSRRELDVTRLIRLLSKNQWYEARHPIAPARVPIAINANFLDMEKWYHEFAKISPVVHSLIVSGFLESVHGSPDDDEQALEEHKVSASYQLGVCYANGTGVPFSPEECLVWLAFAANNGSEKAHKAHSKIAEAFAFPPMEFKNPWTKSHESVSLESSFESISRDDANHEFSAPQKVEAIDTSEESAMPSQLVDSLLGEAESCQYATLAALLSANTKTSSSKDGVSPLHFASSWDIAEAKKLVPQFIKAGADIDAVAKLGPTVGGTPLLWSVHGDHIEHSQLLVENGADPFVSLDHGENALSAAARMHSASHLRMLLSNVRPVQVREHFPKLMEAALGGISRFARLVRHGKQWKTAAEDTLKLLKDWVCLYYGADYFAPVLIASLESSVNCAHARMNTDVQMASIYANKVDPSLLENLLRKSILSFDKSLFNALLEYSVPVTGSFQSQKTLLHLCARIPDHSVAASDFAPRILASGGDVNARDEDGLTPWMDAILERKWDLADLLMKEGADPLSTDTEGFNVMGLCIKAINVGSIKYLLKYCAKRVAFHDRSFLVNEKARISALQLAGSLQMPRAHGMKLEVLGVFLNIFSSFGLQHWQLHYRSDGLFPALVSDATALDIAAMRGNVYAVKNLVKKGAHHDGDGLRAVQHARAALERSTAIEGSMERKNLERCIFIIENWDGDAQVVRKLADDWTNMRTIDESHVDLSW